LFFFVKISVIKIRKPEKRNFKLNFISSLVAANLQIPVSKMYMKKSRSMAKKWTPIGFTVWAWCFIKLRWLKTAVQPLH